MANVELDGTHRPWALAFGGETQERGRRHELLQRPPSPRIPRQDIGIGPRGALGDGTPSCMASDGVTVAKGALSRMPLLISAEPLVDACAERERTCATQYTGSPQ